MNEKKLKVVISAETKELKSEMKEAKKEVKGFKKLIKENSAQTKEDFTKMGDFAKKGLAVGATAMAGAATALIALGGATQEYRNQQSQLTTAFQSAGGSAEAAKATYNDLYRVLGDSGQATEAATHIAKLSTNQKDLSEWTNICQGVYATFGNSLPVEGLTEAANETAKVGQVTGALADALNWAGVNEDVFNAQLAQCNSEAEREQLIRTTLNGIYSDASANYEKNNADILAQNEAQTKLNDAMATLGEAMQPINTMLAELGAEILTALQPYIQDFAENHLPAIKEALTGVGEKIGIVMDWITEHWELVSSIAAVIIGISVALGIVSTVMGIVNAVMMASPVTWIILGIVAAIAAVVAIIVVCIKYWDEIKAAVMNVVNAIKEKIDELKEKISTKFEEIKESVREKLDAIKQFFVNIWNWIKENWQGLLLLIVNPFAGAFKLAYDNCEGFRNKVDGFVAKVKELIKNGFEKVKTNIVEPIKNAKDKVVEVFDKIKSSITEKIEAAKNKVKEICDKIKGFFNFEAATPKIKMPHFSITPKGWKVKDLLEGSIPKLGISWYAKGGVFDKPTLFNYGNNSIGGLGENGAEAIVPLENNTEWLDRIAERLMGNGTPIVLQVDGKVFAQTAVNSINDLTKQSGSLQLQIV